MGPSFHLLDTFFEFQFDSFVLLSWLGEEYVPDEASAQ